MLQNNRKFYFLIFLCTIIFGACNNIKSDDEIAKDEKLAPKDSLSKAIANLSEKISKDPENIDLLHKRAKLYIEKNDLNEALNDMRIVMSKDTTKANFFFTLSDLYFRMGKINGSKAALLKCISIDEKYTEAYLKLAELYLYLKDYPKVFENANKATELDAENAKAYFIRGIAYKEKGDTNRAINSFQTTVEKDQQYYHAYMQLGLLFAAKHNKLAIDYYNNALNLKPKSIEAYYGLGMFYQEHGAYNKAIETYTTINKIDPKYKFAYYNLGYIDYVYLNVIDVAMKNFSAAINADSTYAEAYYMRGLCHEAGGDLRNAKTDFQRALKFKVNYEKAIKGINRLEKFQTQVHSEKSY